MPIICSTIWTFLINTTGSPASTEVRGNTAAHLSEQLPLLTTKQVKDLLSTIMIRFSKRKLLTRVFLSATHIHASRKYRKKKNSTVKFNINDDVNHPKFGKGTIEHIEQLEGSVRLHVRFGEDLKKIDQKWLLQANLKKAGASRHI
mgnify:CR=1 FL=1